MMGLLIDAEGHVAPRETDGTLEDLRRLIGAPWLEFPSVWVLGLGRITAVCGEEYHVREHPEKERQIVTQIGDLKIWGACIILREKGGELRGIDQSDMFALSKRMRVMMVADGLRVDPCRCGRFPVIERSDRYGIRYKCPACTDIRYPWNRTLTGAALDWNAARGR